MSVKGGGTLPPMLLYILFQWSRPKRLINRPMLRTPCSGKGQFFFAGTPASPVYNNNPPRSSIMCNRRGHRESRVWMSKETEDEAAYWLHERNWYRHQAVIRQNPIDTVHELPARTLF